MAVRTKCQSKTMMIKQYIDGDEAEELVSMARGCDIPIYEHCYLAGLVDGMHLKATLEQMKAPDSILSRSPLKFHETPK